MARQFAHLHNVRVWHLEKRAKDLSVGLMKFATRHEPSRVELTEALTASGVAIETFLADLHAGRPKRRGFKKGLYTSLAYFVAHDAHHRGVIMATLKDCGLPVPKDLRYGVR